MTEGPDRIIQVLLDMPLGDVFDYRIDPAQAGALGVGSWVVVPWGNRRQIGLVAGLDGHPGVAPDRIRPVEAVLEDAPRLPQAWLEFLRFVAGYYHRKLGEVALPALPKLLRTPPAARARRSVFARLRARPLAQTPRATPPAAPEVSKTEPQSAWPPAAGAGIPLNPAQAAALAGIREGSGFRVSLIHGVTGSGKTEVYLQWLAQILAGSAQSQALLLVPEIGLTPQLEAQLEARFGGAGIAVLHSDLPDAQRAAQWLAAVEGRVRLVVGTRLAVLTPLPHLAAIVVDEEHDASYKQQEGVRYSARDLAIALASRQGIPVLLGSATPSLESWLSARRGRYRLHGLPEPVHGGAWPRLRRVDPRRQSLRHGLTSEACEAIGGALARGEQALVFINRRGFAPVLACDACGWVSGCEHCAAYRVLHRRTQGVASAHAGSGSAPGARAYFLQCHHCGAQAPVPRRCPECGNIDLSPLGRGSQRLEEGLRELFPAARIARLDRDVARHRGAAREVIEAAHRGEVDLLVGTQMLAKGHDFRRLSCVVVVDADAGLYSADFRAPERLFSVLMQVAGRAGRSGLASEVIIQTRFGQHPLFEALARRDFPGHANMLLAERQQAALPPFVHQALLRAEGTTMAAVLAFLEQARACLPQAGPEVTRYDPVPMPMARLAGRERAQLLLESVSRSALHALLRVWLPAIGEIKSPVRWQLEVDPIEI